MNIAANIAELLKSPPDEFRPYPFWFWNANLSADEITWQLDQCRDQKIYTVLIHPRHGLVTPYLGQEFMAMVVHTVKEAARLGMKVWLYDEYNWPSGIVAGRLLRDYPQYKMKFLNHTYRESEGNREIQPSFQESDFPNVQAVNLDSGDIRSVVPNEKLPPGRWGLAEFHLKFPTIALDSVCGHSHAAPEHGYLDVLNSDAVATFIKLTHELYYQHLREYFGSVILGFFTDEPGVIYDFDYSYDFGHAMTHNLPWTPSLESHFRQTKGYDLRDKLIHLIADVPGAEKTRRDYWNTVSELYTTAYHRQISRWCESHNVAYTGHVVCEEMSLHYQGDIHNALKYFHIPGLDWTSRCCTPESAPVYTVAKTVASIAHRYNRPFTVCENYGATSWSLTLNDMKRVMDYLYVLGVNQMCIHGFFYNVRAARAHECPPSEFFQAPWWKFMSIFSDYTALLGSLLSQGRHLCATGILVPTQSYFTQNNRTYLDPTGQPAFYAKTLDVLTRFMLQAGIDFDIIFDSALKDTSVGPQGIEWNNERIDTLIIPPSQSLDPGLQSKLDQFEKLGGTIIRIPDFSDTIRDELCEKLNSRRVQLRENNIETTGLIVHRRLLSDSSILCFACNASDTDRPQADLIFPEKMNVCEIDLEKRSLTRVDFSCSDKNTTVHTAFRPHQAKMFLLTTEPIAVQPQLSVAKGKTQTIVPGPDWTITLEKENVLKLTQFLHISLPGTPRTEINARVTCDDVVSPVRLLLEGSRYEKITVNHTDLTHRRQPCRYFDSDQYTVDITDHLRPGENRISMQYAPEYEDTFISGLMSCAGIQTIFPHIFLIGNFSVTPDLHLAKPVSTIKTGPWQPQGFPHYAGTVTYQTNFMIDPSHPISSAVLTCSSADNCIEVLVNDIPCGKRVWEPYAIDITNAITPGQNTLTIKVTNTPTDLLRPIPTELNTDNPQAFLRYNNTQNPPSGLLEVIIDLTR